jgi:hypothetical protein
LTIKRIKWNIFIEKQTNFRGKEKISPESLTKNARENKKYLPFKINVL